jgi:arsenate reductase
MKSFTFYWLPACSTCKKAAAFLQEQNVEIERFRDLKADPLTREEVEKLAAKAGGADRLFSRRARKYREMRLNERELSEDEMLDLMASEYTFIKRPVLVSGDRAVAGFSEKSYSEFLR